MKLDSVYFDLDGTLVDSEVLHARCWNDILDSFSIHYDESEFCRMFSGKATVVAAEQLIAKHGLSLSIEELAKRKNDLFTEIAKTSLPPLLPGVYECIEGCRALGLKLALVTGSAKSEALAILHGHNLYSLFDVVVTRDDVTHAKPHPEPYLQAKAALNAHRGVAVEDTHTGLTAANAANLLSIVVPNKFSLTQDISIADIRCDNLFSALGTIKNSCL